MDSVTCGEITSGFDDNILENGNERAGDGLSLVIVISSGLSA